MSILSYMRRWLTVQPASVSVGRYDVPSGERVEEQDVLALSAANACGRLLAGTIGSMSLTVTRPMGNDEGDRVAAKTHPLYRLLHDYPNAEQTAFDFFEGGALSLEFKGNMLARKDRTGDRVTALLPMQWDDTGVRRNRSGEIVYEWRGEALAAEEVLHIRGFGGDALGGLSTIAVAAAAFGLAKATNKAAGAVFRNGIRTNVALIAERDLTVEQMHDAAAIIEEKYAGAMNAGRPLILNNGLKASPLSMNPEDAQMLQSRAFNVEDVCRFFLVPPHMVGHAEKSTSWGTGIEQQTLGFLKFALRPRLKRIEAALEQQLLSAEDRGANIRIEFNLESLLRGDSAGRAAFYREMTSIGAMTINEVRAKENLPKVAGGDVPRMQMQNVPITAPTPPSAVS